MKGYHGFNLNGEEIFYVPQNFILKKTGRSIKVDSNPSHLEELTLHFSKKKINKEFTDEVIIADSFLKKFQKHCFNNNPNSYLVALEIFDYSLDTIKLNSALAGRSFKEFSVTQGYNWDK